MWLSTEGTDRHLGFGVEFALESKASSFVLLVLLLVHYGTCLNRVRTKDVKRALPPGPHPYLSIHIKHAKTSTVMDRNKIKWIALLVFLCDWVLFIVVVVLWMLTPMVICAWFMCHSWMLGNYKCQWSWIAVVWIGLFIYGVALNAWKWWVKIVFMCIIDIYITIATMSSTRSHRHTSNAIHSILILFITVLALTAWERRTWRGRCPRDHTPTWVYI